MKRSRNKDCETIDSPAFIRSNFETCSEVPRQDDPHKRRNYGGGIVQLEGKVVWGCGKHVYKWNKEEKWETFCDGVEVGARLAMCGGSLVAVGGLLPVKDESGQGLCSMKVMVWRDRKWTLMTEMLIGCELPCVVSVGGGGLMVMGGWGNEGRRISYVQVFDGVTQTWHFGPQLPEPCGSISAVVNGDLVYLLGGWGMDTAVWCANITDLTSKHPHVKQQSVWSKLPDVPYSSSSVCVVDNVLLAIGGTVDQNELIKTSAINAFCRVNQKWQHVGDMPFGCSRVDTLLLLDGRLLVVDRFSRSVLRINVQGLDMLAEQRLYEQTVLKGYVEASVIKCLVLGAAGVGKTHLKHLLLNKDPPEECVSTGLCQNMVRAISFSRVGVADQKDDWFVPDNDQTLLSVIGGTIKDGVSKAPSLDDGVSTFPKTDIDASKVLSGGVGHYQSISANINTKTHNLEDYSSDQSKQLGAKWIQLIDSGDQLQYHDVLPFFIQNTLAVTIFVLNLSEKLSDQPTTKYYGAGDKCAGKSSFSHKQILQHCLGTIQASNARPLIIIVGTHRDAQDTFTESIAEKNQQLKALLNPIHFKVVFNGEDLNQVIFPMNVKAPDITDRQLVREIKRKIVSKLHTSFIKMPIASSELEVNLSKLSHNGILSLQECKEKAKQLHVEGDMFSTALSHLVHHSMFLYYQDVLPQTVFCDPQVLLTKVTELMEYHHSLRDHPDTGVAADGDLVMFRDHGILSVKLLETFPMHYKDGLFTPQDLMKLLKSLHVIAEVGHEKYFMPALLPQLDKRQIQSHLSEHSKEITPLIIRPTKGCIPSGLFCCLAAHLVHPSNPFPWKVCMDGEKPLCLYRNCMSLERKNSTDIVTLINKFSRIEVHVRSTVVLSTIYKRIKDGIKCACQSLKYYDANIEDAFEDAFKCPGERCCKQHNAHEAVVIREQGPVYKWKCTKFTHHSGALSKNQLMWFEECTIPKPRHVESDGDEVSAIRAGHEGQTGLKVEDKPTIKLLTGFPSLYDGVKKNLNIIEKTSNSYSNLGMHLLDDDNCDIVESLEVTYRHDPVKIAKAVYKKWISGTGRKPVTWHTLIDVLRIIEKNSLADDIEHVCKMNTSG